MNYQETTTAQLGFLRRQREQLKSRIGRMPEGRLIRKKARRKTYYYTEQNGRRISLADQPELVRQYLEKEKCNELLKSIEQDIPLLERTLREYQPIQPSDAWWNSLEQEKNRYKEEEKRNAYNGVYYRSKSEMMIASMLTSYGIEFKYEAGIEVNGRTIYPDFIVKRPRDGKLFIWEHFGMITDDRYLKKAYRKLEDYHSRGIDLWDRLLISFDQEDGGISADGIDKMIRTFLL